MSFWLLSFTVIVADLVIYLSDKYANSENNIASRKLLDTCKVTYKKMHIDDEMKNIEIKL